MVEKNVREQFADVLKEEQETTINILYDELAMEIYTCRKFVYYRLLEKLGEPTKKTYYKGKVDGAWWRISFLEKVRCNYALSRPIVIGNIGKEEKAKKKPM